MPFIAPSSLGLSVIVTLLFLIGIAIPHTTMAPDEQSQIPPVFMAVDPTAQLGLPDVRKGALAFSPLDGGKINLGKTPAALWLRVSVDNPTQHVRQRWFNLGTARLHDIRVFTQENGQWQEQQAGMTHSFSTRAIDTVAPIFPVTVPPKETKTAYVRVTTETLFIVRPRVWELSAYMTAEARQVELFYFGVGATLLAAALCLIAAFILRELGLLFFGLAIVPYQLFRWSVSGLAFRELWPGAPGWAISSIGFFLMLTGSLFVLTHRHLLQTAHYFPRIDRFLGVLLFAFIALCITTLFTTSQVVVTAMLLPGLPLSAISLLLGFLAWRRGFPLFGYVVAGYMLPWHLLVLQYLGFRGWIPLPSLLTDYSRAWAVLLSATIVLTGLGMRIVTLRRELWQANHNRRVELEAEVEQRTAELQTAKQRSDTALQEQRQLLSMVSHEVRTPLANISAATQLLELKPALDVETQALHRIRRASHRLADFLNNCLAEERINAESWQLHLQPVPVKELIQEAISQVRLQSVAHEVIPVWSTDDTVQLWCDKQLIEVLLRNLLENAVKYSPDNPRIEVGVNVLASGQMVLFVSDQGSGIDEGEQAQVFDKFYRSTRTGRVPGAGLGLYLCGQIAALHHAHINLHSHKGRGTRIEIVFPEASHDTTDFTSSS